jgi:DNA-binding NarL/FixJ family response regulator
MQAATSHSIGGYSFRNGAYGGGGPFRDTTKAADDPDARVCPTDLRWRWPPMTAAPSIRVMVADDHPLLREGVAAVLAAQPDMILAGEAETGLAAIEGYRRWRPDVTLMDLQMPDMGGVEAVTAIRSEFPDARIVILTTYLGDVQAMRALKAGAMAYLLKSSLRRELLTTIREAHRGLRHLQPEVANAIALG